MPFNLFKPSYPNSVVSTLQLNSNTTVLGYKASYTTGISNKVGSYSLTYVTNNLTTYYLDYSNPYTRKYDDTVLFRSLSYIRNRDVMSLSLPAKLSYDTTEPLITKFVYTIAYSFEKQKTEKVLVGSIKYFSTWYTNKIFPYSMEYWSKGEAVDTIRKRYTVRYNTETVGSKSFSYKIKYNVSFFNSLINPYTITYSTISGESVLTDISIFKREDGKYDLIARLRGSLNTQKDEYFYVFSNLPKYQILEYNVDEDLPYIDEVDKNQILDIFGYNTYTNYYDMIFIRLKDVEPLNPIALDVYKYPEYKKANKAKSYFFKLGEEDFIQIDKTVSGQKYVSYNMQSNSFQYEYLNFTDVSITPIFNNSDSCCFSQKILTPDSKVIGGGCSPF